MIFDKTWYIWVLNLKTILNLIFNFICISTSNNDHKIIRVIQLFKKKKENKQKEDTEDGSTVKYKAKRYIQLQQWSKEKEEWH